MTSTEKKDVFELFRSSAKEPKVPLSSISTKVGAEETCRKTGSWTGDVEGNFASAVGIPVGSGDSGAIDMGDIVGVRVSTAVGP